MSMAQDSVRVLAIAGLKLITSAMLLAQNTVPGDAPFDFTERQRHWAWQPVKAAPTPTVRTTDWPLDPIDNFILAALESRNLAPTADAAPSVWLRRVHFDLTGLPPSSAEVTSFLSDHSLPARVLVVDALLDSPHFGERWGRHWLDIVRYAESLGHEFDFPMPNAWRYRDYVIRAFNSDVSFDQFGKEHIAGDLLTKPRIEKTTNRNESVQGTAFWWFAEQTHSPVDAKQHQANRIDNQVDVLSKAFIGMTVACARCHDHKFDAIRTADYYAFYGFVKSSRYVQQPLHVVNAAALLLARNAHQQLAALATMPGLQPVELPPLRSTDRLLGDCGAPALPTGFTTIGTGFCSAPCTGPFVIRQNEHSVTLHQLPGSWAMSTSTGSQATGILLSPDFTILEDYLHVEVAGENARLLLVVDGFNLLRDPLYGELHRAVNNPNPHWITFSLQRWRGSRAHLQCIDQPTQDLADPDHENSEYPSDGWLAVRRIYYSTQNEPPRKTADETIASSTAGSASVTLSTNGPAEASALAAYRAALEQLPPNDTLPGMTDGSGEDEHIFLRGDHDQLGKLAPRKFLEAVSGSAPMTLPCGSGRLQLAESIFAPSNPLPSRVFVNRIWHHLFGRGLVRSVDNFGRLGDLPSNPQLLDHLALAAMANGWSWKRTIRRIVLSRTYGLASNDESEAAQAIDPDNLLLHRQNLRRLEGEALRDSLLSFAGRLDARMGGPSVPVPLDSDDRARGKPAESGPLDGYGRRSIYLAVRRNFLDDFLATFDTPQPFATVGARNVSNVPAQSLALLNDSFTQSMARLAAEHALMLQGNQKKDPLDQLFLAAFARNPSLDEATDCNAFLNAHLAGARSTDAWAELAHVLVNRKEFQFIQ